MNYLRLRRDDHPISEYFIDGKPANYLKDIKDLNIIVGANNSRKSRFMRNVINLEHRVIIESTKDVNTFDSVVDGIFKDFSKELLDVKIMSFVFNDFGDAPVTYQEIRGFFDRRSNMDTGLTLLEIKALLKDIIKNISTVAVTSDIDNLMDNVRVHQLIIGLITSIYERLESTLNGYSHDTPNDSGIRGITYRIAGSSQWEDLPYFEEKLTALKSTNEFLIDFLKNKVLSYLDANLVYIPVLRASRTLVGADTEVFKKTLKKQYALSDNTKLSIETGLDLYKKIEVARNGHRTDRENFAAFEDFISKVFFGGKIVDIIAVKSSSGAEEHVKVSIQDDLDDIPVYDLGDGIQSIISLLLPIFTAKEKSWIFIDEPENHLHPGFQNIFLHAISQNEAIKKKGLKFFINTHSNHLLSEALLGRSETEILVFSRRDKDSSNIQVFSGNEYNTLEMLGVFNTSVLISACSVWVEGITDRLYLRAFLRAYINTNISLAIPTEGFHYSFVEYAGNNVVHYDFDHELTHTADNAVGEVKAFFLNSNVFLLADSDFTKDDRHAFYEKISKSRSNFEYFKTGLPEIENLIPDGVLKSWLTDTINCLPGEVEACFSIANPGIKLGEYFDNKFTFRNSKRKFTIKGQGGTLRQGYKMKLAEFVNNGVTNGSIDWDQLKESSVLADLVPKLYKFILDKSGIGKSG